MPLYSYECPCGAVFEELKPVSERKEEKCTKCGMTAKQRITTVAFDPRMGLDSGFPTMVERWNRTHRKAAIKENKRVAS